MSEGDSRLTPPNYYLRKNIYNTVYSLIIYFLKLRSLYPLCACSKLVYSLDESVNKE